MYTSRRSAWAHVSDDSVMRDVTMETCDLRVSVIRAGVSRQCVSHIVRVIVSEVISQKGEFHFS
jgi:hypothetical protein